MVTKNNKRDRENHRTWLGKEKWGVEPRAAKGSWQLTGNSPLLSLSRGWIFQEKVIFRTTDPNTVLMPQSSCLLVHWLLVPWDILFLLSLGSLKSSKLNNYVSSWMESQEIRSLLVKNGGVYQVWHPADLPTWRRGNEFKWNTLLSCSHARKWKASQLDTSTGPGPRINTTGNHLTMDASESSVPHYSPIHSFSYPNLDRLSWVEKVKKWNIKKQMFM